MNDDKNKKIIINEWLINAQEDEGNASVLLKHKDVSPSLVCFISQQMAEKYLKSLLIFYSNDYPKIHDLVKLGNTIGFYDKNITELREFFVVLNPYYIGTRYAADFPEGFTWKMAEEAYTAAKKIKEYVLGKIK